MRTPFLLGYSLVFAGCATPAWDTEKPPEETIETDPTVDSDTDAAVMDSDPGIEDPLTAVIVDIPFDDIPVGEPVMMTGQIMGSTPALTSAWTSSIDGLLGPCEPDSKGACSIETDALSAGEHMITLDATDGIQGASDTEPVYICEFPEVETFDTNTLDGWVTFGDAGWDPGGWIEITGNSSSRNGSIYKVDERINAGNFAFSFSIATGDGINTGGDVFSVNVWNVADIKELQNIVDTAWNGGCLGYGVSGDCGHTSIGSFHIEFDTWWNNGNPNTDPTTQNHIGIMTNGDPTTHHLWTNVPNLENLVWRDIRVEVMGSTVTVWANGNEIISGDIPGFQFEGGYLGVSGSTGYATNFHRFDNLLFEKCEVPKLP